MQNWPATMRAVGSVIGLFTGTLIEPAWVLTAAHGAELLETMVPDASKRSFVVGGAAYRVDAIFLPPGQKSARPEINRPRPQQARHRLASVGAAR